MLEALDLTGAIEAFRQGTVSPCEYLDHTLAAIKRLDERVGAFITVCEEDSLRAAERATAAWSENGADPDFPSLMGAPIPVKDVTPVAGVRLTMGSKLFAGFEAPMDADVVKNLKSAGAIIVGKTTVPEFGLGVVSEPLISPAARSPHDLSRSAGGSSGGSAAAVAAGMVPAAHGNDGGGSIRIPAAGCGIVGLKASRGRISTGPAGAALPPVAADGTLSRTVRDAALLLDAMAIPDPADPIPYPAGPPNGWTRYLESGPKRLRIGRYHEPVAGTPEEEWLAVLRTGSELMTEAGHEVVDISPPYGPQFVDHFTVIVAAAAASLPVPEGAEELLDPYTRELRERGKAVSVAQFIGAWGQLALAARLAITATKEFDAVMTPTLPRRLPLVGASATEEDRLPYIGYTAPYNVSGQPAMSIPVAAAVDGFPLSVQLVGRPGDESTLLVLGQQIESHRPLPSFYLPPSL